MPIWLIFSGMGVFLVFIVIISTIAATMSGQYQKPKFTSFSSQKSQFHTQNQRSNPYIIKKSIEIPLHIYRLSLIYRNVY